MDITLENESLLVAFSSEGGALTRIYDKEKKQEILYDGKGAWGFSDHILFPVIGANNSYSLKGRDYLLPKRHGFAWYSSFQVSSQNRESACLLLERKEGEDQYPFPFRLEISYVLEGRKLIRTGRVTPLSEAGLVFQYGLHPAFRVDFLKAKLEVAEGSVLYVLDKENGIIQKEIRWPFPLSWHLVRSEITSRDTLVIDNPKGRIALDNGMGGRIELVSSCPYFALWTPEKEAQDDFLCLESWYGISPYVGMEKDLSKRKGVNQIKKEKTFVDVLSF